MCRGQTGHAAPGTVSDGGGEPGRLATARTAAQLAQTRRPRQFSRPALLRLAVGAAPRQRALLPVLADDRRAAVLARTAVRDIRADLLQSGNGEDRGQRAERLVQRVSSRRLVLRDGKLKLDELRHQLRVAGDGSADLLQGLSLAGGVLRDHRRLVVLAAQLVVWSLRDGVGGSAPQAEVALLERQARVAVDGPHLPAPAGAGDVSAEEVLASLAVEDELLRNPVDHGSAVAGAATSASNGNADVINVSAGVQGHGGVAFLSGDGN